MVKTIHKSILKLMLVMCAVILSNPKALSQTTSFMNYGMEQGLSHAQVQSIIQDNDGNLWIGTISGLIKYNGREFKTYTRNNDSLAENWVTTFCKDKNGNLLIGHWTGNVSMVNHTTKKIENLHLASYTKFRTVTSIAQDDQNRFWIATEGAGILIFDVDNKKIIPLTNKEGLPNNNVFSVCNVTFFYG